MRLLVFPLSQADVADTLRLMGLAVREEVRDPLSGH